MAAPARTSAVAPATQISMRRLLGGVGSVIAFAPLVCVDEGTRREVLRIRLLGAPRAPPDRRLPRTSQAKHSSVAWMSAAISGISRAGEVTRMSLPSSGLRASRRRRVPRRATQGSDPHDTPLARLLMTRMARALGTRIHSHLQRDHLCPDGCAKIYRFPFIRNHAFLSASRPHAEGRTRRHDTLRRGAVAAGLSGAFALDDWQFADGQAVWSWRPDAGAKPWRHDVSSGDGGKQARSPGRARSSR
ncbi:hypothetical protein ACVILH_003154 [Bradyrhizobium sp. USDA 4353]